MTSSNRQRISRDRNSTDLTFCIVWAPVHPITSILPFVGHTGIADSRGIVSDFQGSYCVGDQGHMAFGAPTRYLKMDIGRLPGGAECWDKAIQQANRVYSSRIHNICCDNCHSHVSFALNQMPLEQFGIRKWDMVKLCFLIFFRAPFISFGGFLCQFLPFGVLCTLLIVFTKVL